MHWYWHDLAWDCYTSFSPNLYQSYDPLFSPKFHFRSISWEQMDQIQSNLGLLAVIFCKFVREIWPLIGVRITLPLKILRNSGLLLHAKHCSGAIVRFSDNTSYTSSQLSVWIKSSPKLLQKLEYTHIYLQDRKKSRKEKSSRNWRSRSVSWLHYCRASQEWQWCLALFTKWSGTYDQ